MPKAKRVYGSIDDIKRFMPEAILEEREEQIPTYGYLDRPIKSEPLDSLETNEDLTSTNSMEKMDMSPPDASDVDDDEDDDDDDSDDSDVIIEDDGQVAIHMDIREPLTTLRALLEEKTGMNLEDFGFSLQDTQLLEEYKNLVDQCVQGEGIVQVNCELKGSLNYGKRINIVDVLKPAEEYIEIISSSGDEDEEEEPDRDDQELRVRWIVDNNYKKDQEKLGIPLDPAKWSVAHVRHWLMWAVRQFNLSGIDLSRWAIPGSELSKMTHDQFRTKVPRDPYNTFWTHFELLRKCKIVAVNPPARKRNQNKSPSKIQNNSPSKFQCKKEERDEASTSGVYNQPSTSGVYNQPSTSGIFNRISLQQKTPDNISTRTNANALPDSTTVITRTTRSNSGVYPLSAYGDDYNKVEEFDDDDDNDDDVYGAKYVKQWNVPGGLGATSVCGPVQLWQFLLDLLTDRRHRSAIQWLDDEGEFKLLNPELVAHLWGLRKNKPTMNYEKLSRALRYYYDGEMIAKVHGKRFVYKFVCDLKQMLGYNAGELKALVIEAEHKYNEKQRIRQGIPPPSPLYANKKITVIQ